MGDAAARSPLGGLGRWLSGSGRVSEIEGESPPAGAVALALGAVHTCALLTGGAVKCWGGNDNGQLGIGSNSMQTSPQAVSLGTGDSSAWRRTCATPHVRRQAVGAQSKSPVQSLW